MQQLFHKVSLGPLELKNRLVMTAMSTRFAANDGRITKRLIEYYALRARGGAGLITVEEASIHPLLPHIPNALGIFNSDFIPGLTALTSRIHEAGSRAALQIGLYFRRHVNGFPRFVASAQGPDSDSSCKELNTTELAYLSELFADAADRSRQADFDAVEIHACHGCLLSEFLSPYWNKRSDEYGGNREGRFRFILETLDAIRRKLGPDYPVIFRISGNEFTAGGFTPEDAVHLSSALEHHGVSAINVSGGLGHENFISIPPAHVPRGILLPAAAQIKEAVSVPVIVGNSMTLDLAVDALQKKKADLIGLGRPLIADPYWPEKVRQNRLDEIRHCIRCNQGCFGGLRDPSQQGITCIYNPQVGREHEEPVSAASTRKRVVIVGGGPAGCEAARVAKLRGHEVVLFERLDRLGGQTLLASRPPHKQDFLKIGAYYHHELIRLGVNLRLNTQAGPELLNSMHADVYLLAQGSFPALPSIPGSDLNHVLTAHDVLSLAHEVNQDPVVVIGGGATGLETADFLSDRGLNVSVVELLEVPGREMLSGIGVRESLLSRLQTKGVEVYSGHRVQEILRDGVMISDRPLIGGGTETVLPAKCVVLAMGMKSNREISCSHLPANAACHQLGDNESLGNAYAAIHHAFDLVKNL
ncbi:MAG: NAD(P)/FAD-dependent oxidoreductase [Desulfohalobiaceae bacterium]|nr:NAD(P)/FAD-dependent oxidoreductase [Desulfohalobiaceae bacterium]MCF8104283.1 NAD(P)/FAD-dependent oxidoreductase [Desulfohalobiaceae bacterium]